MPLVPAKCTQCGANLQVNSENECSICSACGTPFITEKAIINYNTTVNNTINNTYNVDSKTIVSGNNEVHIHNDELNRLFLIEGGELTEYKGNRSEITIPESTQSLLAVKYATAGVGTIPRSITSAPPAVSPAVRAESIISPEMRVSLPTMNRGL